MKVGDVVVFSRLSDGRESCGIIVRREGSLGLATWVVEDARGQRWRRIGAELRLAQDADGLAVFLDRVPGPQAGAEPVPAAKRASPRGASSPKLADRVLIELAEGVETAREIALRLDARPESISERLSWLESRGLVVRIGFVRSTRGHAMVRWRLASQASAA